MVQRRVDICLDTDASLSETRIYRSVAKKLEKLGNCGITIRCTRICIAARKYPHACLYFVMYVFIREMRIYQVIMILFDRSSGTFKEILNAENFHWSE